MFVNFGFFDVVMQFHHFIMFLIWYHCVLCVIAVTNIDTVISQGLATAEGLAIDWITRHIYWVESNLDQIEVADFDGKHRTTLIAGSMESPRAIVVDPNFGLVTKACWVLNNVTITYIRLKCHSEVFNGANSLVGVSAFLLFLPNAASHMFMVDYIWDECLVCESFFFQIAWFCIVFVLPIIPRVLWTSACNCKSWSLLINLTER